MNDEIQARHGCLREVSPESLSNEAPAREWLRVVPAHPSRKEDESSELSVGSSYALIVPMLPVGPKPLRHIDKDHCLGAFPMRGFSSLGRSGCLCSLS